jgi:serine/threonine-protein kinase
MSEKKGHVPSAIADTLLRAKGAKPKEPLAERIIDVDPLIGNMLSERYLLLGRIGQGGMGTVYVAEDTNLDGKKVAVKVLPKYLAKMPGVASRFVQEAKLAPKIENENIINVTDRGTTPEGVPFFVMEYLKGSDLGQALASGPMGWSQRTADIILQICRALHKAHETGIVHRDLKPENVFLLERSDGKDFIKLLDFGIAKMLEQAQSYEVHEGSEVMPADPKTSDPRMTQAGVVLGTPAYMAPEQARGENIDHRVDIYALGTILYELVCGAVPFDAEESTDPFARPYKILDMQKNEEPLPPSRKTPGLKIPPELEALIMKSLQKDPAARFQTMKEFEEAMASIPVPQQSPANGRSSQQGIRLGARSIIGYREIKKAENTRVVKRRRVFVAAAVALALAGGIAAYKLRPEILNRFFPATKIEIHAEDAQK